MEAPGFWCESLGSRRGCLEGVLSLRAQPSFAECLICSAQALPGQALPSFVGLASQGSLCLALVEPFIKTGLVTLHPGGSAETFWPFLGFPKVVRRAGWREDSIPTPAPQQGQLVEGFSQGFQELKNAGQMVTSCRLLLVHPNNVRN